jgi:hypothetical protein
MYNSPLHVYIHSYSPFGSKKKVICVFTFTLNMKTAYLFKHKCENYLKKEITIKYFYKDFLAHLLYSVAKAQKCKQYNYSRHGHSPLKINNLA